MLEIKNLTKNYGPNIGNFNINLEIKTGHSYAIVGPNGAGKTTLIRQILGFVKPSEGEVKIDGLDPWTNREKLMENIGYVAGEISLYDDFTGIEYLKLIAKLKPNTSWEYVQKLIQHFDIDTKRKIKKMSKGMKQKIAIISATMNKPKILILDEPTSGLDPIMQQQFNILIDKLKKENKTTVLICSHIFEQVIKLADTVGFIKDGKLIEEYKVQKKDIKKLETIFKKLFQPKVLI